MDQEPVSDDEVCIGEASDVEINNLKDTSNGSLKKSPSLYIHLDDKPEEEYDSKKTQNNVSYLYKPDTQNNWAS